MSRSYKKEPWICDRSPYNKNQANRRVRRYKRKLKDGRSYRKLYSSYDICDFKWYCNKPKTFRK